MMPLFVDKKNRQLDRATVERLAIERIVNTGVHYEHAEFQCTKMGHTELMSWAVDDDGNFPADLFQE